MYWWQIKWKSYNEPPLMVSQKQAEYIQKKLEEPGSRDEKFKINGETYSYGSIDNITQTSHILPGEQTKMLYAAETDTQDHGPIINEDGEVVTNWYKKYVTMREYNEKYVKNTWTYKTLETDGAGAWVAMRLVEKKNWDRPENLMLCDKWEADRLWRLIENATA